MFGNLGMSEIMVLAVVALVVLGPEKFPEYAKIAMRAYRDFRGYIDDIKSEMANELKPVKDEIRELARHNPEEYVEDLAKAISSIDDERETPAKPSGAESAAELDDTAPYADEEASSEPATEDRQEDRESVAEKPAEFPERLDG